MDSGSLEFEGKGKVKGDELVKGFDKKETIMLYSDFEEIIAGPRMAKYLAASGNNSRKAMTLYRANIRLSTEIFSILSLFEVALRNKIDKHYRFRFGNNWLFDASRPLTGFLQSTGCEKSLESVEKVITNLGALYSPDKAVAELTFGFWTYQFASREFSAAGSSLLNILPGRPFGTNHTKVFKKLTSINRIRNRIAHHEPICFIQPVAISTTYAEQKYSQIMEVLRWLGIDPVSFLYGVDGFQAEKRHVDRWALRA